MFNKHQVKREEHKSMLEDIAVVAISILRKIVMYAFETPSQEKVICITPKSAILGGKGRNKKAIHTKGEAGTPVYRGQSRQLEPLSALVAREDKLICYSTLY